MRSVVSNLSFIGHLDTLALGSSCPFLYHDMVLVNGEGVVYLDTRALALHIDLYSGYLCRPATEEGHPPSGYTLIPGVGRDEGN